tara:strand:- start:337 stop:540 length:204 start_codon:yes stop_codon:yes gene_type:complete
MEPLKYVELSGRSHESLNDALEKAVATAPHTNRDHMLVLETYSSTHNAQTTYQIKLKLATKEHAAYV